MNRGPQAAHDELMYMLTRASHSIESLRARAKATQYCEVEPWIMDRDGTERVMHVRLEDPHALWQVMQFNDRSGATTWYIVHPRKRPVRIGTCALKGVNYFDRACAEADRRNSYTKKEE